MNLIKKLEWRYATKRMTGEKVSHEKLDRILDAIRLSASSMGLQPYNVLIVENQELRKQIQQVAFSQPQIVEASHLLIFAAWDNVNVEHVDDYINNIAEVRGVSPDTLEGFRGMMLNMAQNRTQEQNFEWAARQAYIALGTGLVAAAVEEVDAAPMEGFLPQELDKLLNLNEKGLRSVVLLALGYRDEEKDSLVNAKKVRRDKDKFFFLLD